MYARLPLVIKKQIDKPKDIIGRNPKKKQSSRASGCRLKRKKVNPILEIDSNIYIDRRLQKIYIVASHNVRKNRDCLKTIKMFWHCPLRAEKKIKPLFQWCFK